MARQWRTPLPLRWRVIALLTALAALLIVDVVVGAMYTNRLEAEQRIAGNLRPVEEVPERLVAGLVDQQNSVRGFALTSDERLLRTYEERQRDEGRAILKLRRQLAGDVVLLALLDGVTEGAQAWHQRVAEPVIDATRAGRMREAARLIATADEPLFSALRRDAETLATALDRRVETSQERAVMAGARLDQQLFLSSVFGLLLLLASGLLIRRWLTRPVTELSLQLGRVSAGHLNERIVGTGPVEFQQLGQDVEGMRRRILEELEESRRAVEGMQQNAPLVVSLRRQLVGADVSLPRGLNLATRLEPAEGVLAGDWIETMRLDEDRMGLIVVDVSGHGPDAGLRALWLKHLLVPALNLELEPADALHWVAGQIGDTGEWFATCVVLELDVATGRCSYANAGHPPALLCGPAGIQELPPTGPLFSDLPGATWETARTTLDEEDLLVVYTDGIVEARNAAGEEFGDDRLAAALASATGFAVDAVADEVMGQVHAFGRGRLADDATLVVASRQPVGRDARRTRDQRALSAPDRGAHGI